MGCIYAVGCTGMCSGCSSYRSEEYIGHSEDLMAQDMGYPSYEDYCRDLDQEFEREQRAIDEQRYLEEAYYQRSDFSRAKLISYKIRAKIYPYNKVKSRKKRDNLACLRKINKGNRNDCFGNLLNCYNDLPF